MMTIDDARELEDELNAARYGACPDCTRALNDAGECHRCGWVEGDIEYDSAACVACGSSLEYLGAMGTLVHWRCRGCGAGNTIKAGES